MRGIAMTEADKALVKAIDKTLAEYEEWVGSLSTDMQQKIAQTKREMVT